MTRLSSMAALFAALLLPGPALAQDGDVEVLDLGEDTAGFAPATGAPPPPPTDPWLSGRGWARSRVSSGWSKTDPAIDERVAQQELFAEMDAEGGALSAAVSGVLSFGFFDERTELRARLWEAYADASARGLSLRAGRQRIAWGRSDGFRPNDIWNPADLRDPILVETELERLPVLAARGRVVLGSAELDVVFAPFFEPNRFHLVGSSWALKQPRSFAGLPPEPIAPDLEPFAYDLVGASAGGRLVWTFAGWDLSANGAYGPGPTPWLELDEDGAVLVALVRRAHAGADVQKAFGPFLVRADVAYDSSLVFATRELESVIAPAASGVLGVELQTGELGKYVLLEVFTQRILDEIPEEHPLLFVRQHTVGVSGQVRWTFGPHLGIEVRALTGLSPRSYVVRPQLTWKQGALELRVGASFLGGEEGSFGGHYHRNDAAHAVLKLSL